MLSWHFVGAVPRGASLLQDSGWTALNLVHTNPGIPFAQALSTPPRPVVTAGKSESQRQKVTAWKGD